MKQEAALEKAAKLVSFLKELDFVKQRKWAEKKRISLLPL